MVSRYLSDGRNLKQIMLGLFRRPQEIKIAASRVFGQFVVGIRPASDVRALLVQNRELLLLQLYKFDAADPDERPDDALAKWRCWSLMLRDDPVDEARELQEAVVRARRRLDSTADLERLLQRLVRVHLLLLRPPVSTLDKALALVKMGRALAACPVGDEWRRRMSVWLREEEERRVSSLASK